MGDPLHIAAAGLLVALGVSSVLATNISVATVGLTYQHTGWLLWIGVVCWLVLAPRVSPPGAYRRVVQATALLGTFAVVGWSLDRYGLAWDSARYSQMASGFLENSLSLNQVLLLSIGCTVGWWWAAPKGATTRWLLGVSACAQIVVLLSSTSLGAYAALVAGLVFAVAVVPPGGRRGLSFRWAAVSCALLIAAAFIFMALAMWSESVFDFMNLVGTDRMITWRNALLALRADFVFGRGPDLFSSIVSWDVDSSGRLVYLATSDPHNLLLYWLVGSGIVGLVLALLVAWVVAKKVVEITHQNEHPIAWVVPPMAGVFALAVCLSTVWMSPIAAFAAAALVGTAMARRPTVRTRNPSLRILCAVVVVALVSAGLLSMWPAIDAESRFASVSTTVGDPSDRADQLLDLYEQWPDPSFLAEAGRILDGQGGGWQVSDDGSLTQAQERWLAQARNLRTAAGRDTSWDVRVAILVLKNLRWESRLTGGDLWQEEQAVIAQARNADPSSSLWDFIAALEARRLGRDQEALHAAEAALALGAPPGVEGYLSDIIGR